MSNRRFKRFMQFVARMVLRLLFRVRITGLEHFHGAGERVLVVANHQSLLDPPLLWAFLTDDVTFAIHSVVSRWKILQPLYALDLVHVFPMDPSNPMMTKALVQYLRGNRRAVIFPEGRITSTGALMRIYDGPALVADRADALLLPVRVEGAQYSPVSRLLPGVRRQWFPRITIDILPARKLSLPADLTGRRRRELAGRQLTDIMTGMMFETFPWRRTLFSALIHARQTHGGGHVIVEDLDHRPLDYQGLLTRVLLVARRLRRVTTEDETVGVLLPNAVGAVVSLLALQLCRRVPAMLNFTAGAVALESAIETARIGTIVTSHRFVEAANLGALVEQLGQRCRIVWLDDLLAGVGRPEKLRAALLAVSVAWWWRERPGEADRPAVILFTSGTEGAPKGVVLSHTNIVSNHAQVAAVIDFGPRDTVLNVLPLFHSFGLCAGTLLPLTRGLKVFLYPSPLHYAAIPTLAYQQNATILFGTSTFFANYARKAHPYDFYSLRYAVAGAEKLRDETRKRWMQKFGIRILEGYGVTETSPVLSVNTPIHNCEGTVGRSLPGIECRLEPVEGIDEGGRLHVRGPNIMLGYLLPGRPGELVPPQSCYGDGWHDTGDIVTIDERGYITISGRAKRFAKVGGEMVSLASLELLAERLWPDALHGAIALPDRSKGEQLVLVTTAAEADRTALAAGIRAEGLSELLVPRRVLVRAELPLLGSGKVDYRALTALVRGDLGLD